MLQHSWLRHCLECPHPHWSISFNPNYSAADLASYYAGVRESWWWLKCLGPCHPYERPWWSSNALTWALPIPRYSDHLGNASVDGWPIIQQLCHYTLSTDGKKETSNKKNTEKIPKNVRCLYYWIAYNVYFLFIYLKERHKNREGTKRILISWVPHDAHNRAGPEPRLAAANSVEASPQWQGSNYLRYPPMTPQGCISRKLELRAELQLGTQALWYRMWLTNLAA